MKADLSTWMSSRRSSLIAVWGHPHDRDYSSLSTSRATRFRGYFLYLLGIHYLQLASSLMALVRVTHQPKESPPSMQ